jgi:hypothetical protein
LSLPPQTNACGDVIGCREDGDGPVVDAHDKANSNVWRGKSNAINARRAKPIGQISRNFGSSW